MAVAIKLYIRARNITSSEIYEQLEKEWTKQ